MMKTLLAFAICVAATLALVSVASADENDRLEHLRHRRSLV